MIKDYLLWMNGSRFTYAASIAATWIWAPAIFVSSTQFYMNGIYGFLMFLIPNILTLILFAYFADIIRSRVKGLTLSDVVGSAGVGQERIHLTISVILLISSSTVQLLGIHTLFSAWYPIPKIASAGITSMISLALVYSTGIKGSILTDSIKYAIMAICGAILVFASYDSSTQLNWYGNSGLSIWELLSTFGITTAIGLFSAPYVDQTFWQRTFSLNKSEVKPTFLLAAVLFGLVPLMFGLVGLFNANIPSWNIASSFSSSLLNVVLALAVLSALISTLDSNLCAISAYAYSKVDQNIKTARLSMVILLIITSTVLVLTNLTIVEMFLIYGTIRTCAAIPTILIILGRYNKGRLFYSTLIAAVICPLGYVVVSSNNWIFTVLALFLPLLGYQSKQTKED